MTKQKQLSPFKELLNKQKEITLLNNVQGLAFWDMEVTIPEKAVQQRSEELAALTSIIHDREVAPEIGSMLQKLQTDEEFSGRPYQEKRNVALIQRQYDRNTKIPKDLAIAITKHSAKATESWKKAKKEANFSLFKEDLEKMIELTKKKANYLDSEKSPYDVLLDLSEPGFSTKLYDTIFTEAKKGLQPIITACLESDKQPDMSLAHRRCPIEIQRKIIADLMELINYDLARGRIDEATHPFTSGYYDDVRVTVRYDENDFTSAFFAGLHEGGHALYEQNLPKEYKYQPIGNSSSAAMHEGQARFIENIIGRSPEFWEFYLPRFKRLTGKIFDNVSLDPFVRAINQVQPSKIRIHADPLTYSLHVILRYEIEKDLFADKITVDELPAIWNTKMEEYLGMQIDNDTEGVLQDTHWAWALFGYFPTYSLGSYYNGQLVWKLSQDLPEWKEDLRKGKPGAIHKWLNEKIRNQGKLYDPLVLIKKVTGKEFSVQYFIDNAKKKYGKIYNF